MGEQKKSHNTFSKSEALRFGWQATKKNIWLIVAVLVIPYAISWLFSFISHPLVTSNNGLIKIIGHLVTFIGWVVNLEIGFATFVVFFKLFDKKKTSIKDLFVYFNLGLLFRYFLVSFLYALLVVVGLLLFIIPGIYFATKYWFAPYIYVDKNIGVLEAFKESSKLTKGIKWQLFLLGLLQLLLCLAGLLSLIVGVIVAVSINYLSDIYVYRKLSANK